MSGSGVLGCQARGSVSGQLPEHDGFHGFSVRLARGEHAKRLLEPSPELRVHTFARSPTAGGEIAMERLDFRIWASYT